MATRTNVLPDRDLDGSIFDPGPERVRTPDGDGYLVGCDHDGQTWVVDLDEGGTGRFPRGQCKRHAARPRGHSLDALAR